MRGAHSLVNAILFFKMFRPSVLPLTARRLGFGIRTKFIQRSASSTSAPSQPPSTTATGVLRQPKQMSPMHLSEGHAPLRVQHTTGVLSTSGGRAFAITDMARRSYQRRMFKSAAIAGLIISFVVYFYVYSMYAVQEDDITDEFLEQVMAAEEAELALIQAAEDEQKKNALAA